MNIVFWVLVLMLGVAVYFVLSFAFNYIGNIGLKVYKKFNENIGKEEGGNNNEK